MDALAVGGAEIIVALVADRDGGDFVRLRVEQRAVVAVIGIGRDDFIHAAVVNRGAVAVEKAVAFRIIADNGVPVVELVGDRIAVV